jgi:hypothetical protein
MLRVYKLALSAAAVLALWLHLLHSGLSPAKHHLVLWVRNDCMIFLRPEVGPKLCMHVLLLDDF